MIHVTVADVETVIVDECATAISKVRFEPTYWPHMIVISMACTVLESAHAAVLLAHHKKGHDAKLHARKVLEGLVDLKLLTTDPSYADTMRLADAEYWLKQLKQGQEGNPYVRSFTTMSNIDNSIQAHQNEVDELKSYGARKMTVRDRFEAAGLQSEYFTVFSNLSGHSHSRLDTLIQRHVVEDGEGVGIVAFEETTVEEMQAVLLGLRDWVRSATSITMKYLSSEMDS